MDQLKLLEEAKALSLAGDYKQALALLDSVLLHYPRNLDALRLKGNVLELRVFERESQQGARFVHSKDIGLARACYDQILLLEPNHPGALADLGSHWKSVGDYPKALECYDRVMSLLSSDQIRKLHREELVEALQGKAEIYREQGNQSLAAQAESDLENFS